MLAFCIETGICKMNSCILRGLHWPFSFFPSILQILSKPSGWLLRRLSAIVTCVPDAIDEIAMTNELYHTP